MPPQPVKYNTDMTGEYSVCAELSKKGYIVSLTFGKGILFSRIWGGSMSMSACGIGRKAKVTSYMKGDNIKII
jgi:hypothetical protein